MSEATEIIGALNQLTWPGAVALAALCLGAVGVTWALCWFLRPH